MLQLFTKIYEMTEDEDCFVCVLIDEVESLTASRSDADPGDAMRVVNVLLTQLDRLKTRRNVLIMTTSNHLDKSDRTFL